MTPSLSTVTRSISGRRWRSTWRCRSTPTPGRPARRSIGRGTRPIPRASPACRIDGVISCDSGGYWLTSVYFDDRVQANILSYGQLDTDFKVSSGDGCINVDTGDTKLTFKKSNSLMYLTEIPASKLVCVSS